MARVIWTLLPCATWHASMLSSHRRTATPRDVRFARSDKVSKRSPRTLRPVDEMPTEFHEWFVQFGNGGYVVLYRYDGGQVVILAVRHGKEAGY